MFNKVCVPNETEDLNLSFFNIITGIDESKTSTKHISCQCTFKFDSSRKSNSNRKWNNDKCQCEWKKHHVYEKDYIWNSATCGCNNDKHLASFIDYSLIACDEIKEEAKPIPTKFNEKR